VPRGALLLAMALASGCAAASAADGEGTTTLSATDEVRALNRLFGMSNADCSRPATYDRVLREYILSSGAATRVQFPAGGPHPVVIASPASAHGVFLFRREASGWATYFVAASSRVQALRTSRDGSTLYIVSMGSREAPGDYHVASLSADGRELRCVTLARPELQRSLDHGAFAALSIDERGQGDLVTRATLEHERGTDVEWYGYRTQDEGLSWSEPERRGPPSEPLADLPAPASAPLDAALRAELAR
jgi:hypothetical protein